MDIKNIPLILPNFNQLTYLKNLINWWKWYYPDNRYIILDNASDYQPLLGFYQDFEDGQQHPNLLFRYEENNAAKNLATFLKGNEHLMDYYVICDPDIMPHPATPPHFLEIMKSIIDSAGYHHVGFDLITDDLPKWNKKAGWIQGDEAALHRSPLEIDYKGEIYKAYRAPIDTTFALYSKHNGGWSAPMPTKQWDNSVRIFKAFHLPWYLDADNLNPEMKNYFATCLKRDDKKPSAGRNHFEP